MLWVCGWLQASAAQQLRTAVVCVITQRVVAISYGRFGTTYRSHVQAMEMGPIGCPETSARNYHYSLRNSPDERSSHYECVFVRLRSYTARKAHAPYYIVICGLSGSTIFSTLSQSLTAPFSVGEGGGGMLLNIECAFWYSIQLLFETFHILRRTECHKIKYVCWSSCKVPLFLSDADETWIFWTDFRKTRISNFLKIRPVGAELFHTDGRTDMTKLIVALRSFAYAPKNGISMWSRNRLHCLCHEEEEENKNKNKDKNKKKMMMKIRTWRRGYL